MTHSARSDMAASVTSERVGTPDLDEVLEHLRGPDHGRVRRLADPHHLFLDLGQALEADLHRQVASGDHHGEWLTAGGGDDELRQVRDRLRLSRS